MTYNAAFLSRPADGKLNCSRPAGRSVGCLAGWLARKVIDFAAKRLKKVIGERFLRLYREQKRRLEVEANAVKLGTVWNGGGSRQVENPTYLLSM